jgi:hypothetical protein
MKLHGMAPAAATLFAIGLFSAAAARAAEPPATTPVNVTDSTFGCMLPIDRTMAGALQRSDPRCGAPEPQPGDTVALWKLRALVLTSTAMNWAKSWF